jgi:hypothetical protein
MFSIRTFKRLLLAALFFVAVGAQAEDLRTLRDGYLGPLVAAPDNQVFINPLGFLYGTPTIGFEHALSGGDLHSFTAQFGFRNYGGTGYDLNYLGLLGSYRWWLGNHARLQGFYAGPLGTIQFVNVGYDVGFPATHQSTSASLIGVGGEGGYQWILPFHMTLGVGLNAAYYLGNLSTASGAPSIPFGGLGAGLQGTVGYAF